MPRSFVLTASLGLLLLASVWAPSRAAESDWTGWRGPGRDGWVRGFRPPAAWPKQLRKAWQVKVGTGYASPLVSEGRVYMHARQNDEEVVWCLDVESGEVKWRESYAAPFKIGGGGEYHGKGPKSTPALGDGKLFTMSITGRLSAWDASSGKFLWRREYGSRFKKDHPYWGASTSPLVDEDRVIVHFGGDDRGALIALDTSSGEEVWSQGDDGASYASPILVESKEGRQVIELNMKSLVSVDSKSGRLMWKYEYPQQGTDQNMVTPSYHKGRVLLGGENRGVRSLEPLLEGGAWKVRERWFQKKVALDMSSAVVNGDLLFGFSHYGRGRIFCLDTKTGEVLWQSPGRLGQNATFLSVPGYILALKDNGELQVITASGDRFDKVASYRLADSATWAPPVLLKSGILVKDEQSLTLWSLRAPSR